MDKIIRLDRRHLEELVLIDFESDHQGDREERITKAQMKKRVNERFDSCHEIFFGLRHGKELVGYVTLKPFFPGYKHCEIYWLSVKKRVQGLGVGTTLIRFIENYAKKHGFRKAFLYTGKNMKLTRGFYEKMGYSLINEFPDYYSSGRNTTAVLYANSL